MSRPSGLIEGCEPRKGGTSFSFVYFVLGSRVSLDPQPRPFIWRKPTIPHAAGWHALSATHLDIHRAQIAEIRQRLPVS